MILNMEDGLNKIEGVFAGCATCSKNFLQSICDMNCSPKHSQYLDTNVVTKGDGTIPL